MFEKSYLPKEKQAQVLHSAEQTGVEKFVLTDEFSVIPAYKEILPDGLISDEV